MRIIGIILYKIGVWIVGFIIGFVAMTVVGSIVLTACDILGIY